MITLIYKKMKTLLNLLPILVLIILSEECLSIRHSDSSGHHNGKKGYAQKKLDKIENHNHKCEKIITGLMVDIDSEKPSVPHGHSSSLHNEEKLSKSQLKIGGHFLETIRNAIDYCQYYPSAKFYDFAKSIFGKQAAQDRECTEPFAKVFLQLYNKRLFPDDDESEEGRTASQMFGSLFKMGAKFAMKGAMKGGKHMAQSKMQGHQGRRLLLEAGIRNSKVRASWANRGRVLHSESSKKVAKQKQQRNEEIVDLEEAHVVLKLHAYMMASDIYKGCYKNRNGNAGWF